MQFPIWKDFSAKQDLHFLQLIKLEENKERNKISMASKNESDSRAYHATLIIFCNLL